MKNVLLEDAIVFDPIELNPREREVGAETKTINDFFAEKFGRNKATATQEAAEAISAGTGSQVTDTNTPDAEQATQPEEDRQTEGSAADSRTEGPAFSVEPTEDEKVADSLVQEHGLYDPTLDLPGYQVPPLDL